ncbi:hypothetical protein NRZ32_17080 [Aeromonas dhakensis]|uniref:hypothetical protein n=1 Tax=Aeromonas dhakensis TaxID=196024 RepID=UPI00227D607A|nr:hypothetical protein [Aeromonas dhakensis]WAG10819.1 hypothetical protein NRZ32_17080 [Aeromonas dhakensis]
MYTKKETAKIIDKMIELTQHQKIKWSEEKPERIMNSLDQRVSLIYKSSYLGRILRLYKKEYKYFLDDVQFIWNEEIAIEFLNEDGVSIGSFPETPNAMELYKAVQFQNPAIKNFYNDLFNS